MKYDGKICGECSGTLRYSSNKKRVECQRQLNAEHYRANARSRREYQADYALKNPERVAAHKSRWAKDNSAKMRAIHRRRAGWAPGEHEKAEVARLKVVACGCCGSPEPRSKKGWHADHDHRTGLFRAYLCHPCNVIVGLVERYSRPPDPLVAKYLTLHSQS